jgi:hypothetical protein
MKPVVLILICILSTGACQQLTQKGSCIDQSKVNPDAMCYQVYKPVCGCDNKTYSNDCEARKSGVTSWKEGECLGK